MSDVYILSQVTHLATTISSFSTDLPERYKMPSTGTRNSTRSEFETSLHEFFKSFVAYIDNVSQQAPEFDSDDYERGRIEGAAQCGATIRKLVDGRIRREDEDKLPSLGPINSARSTSWKAGFRLERETMLSELMEFEEGQEEAAIRSLMEEDIERFCSPSDKEQWRGRARTLMEAFRLLQESDPATTHSTTIRTEPQSKTSTTKRVLRFFGGGSRA